MLRVCEIPTSFGRPLKIQAMRTSELLNVSRLGDELVVHLETFHRMRTAIRAPAYTCISSQLGESSYHNTESPLSRQYLLRATAAEWNTQRERCGHLLHSFMSLKLVVQDYNTDPDLRFLHYRDRDRVFLDCAAEGMAVVITGHEVPTMLNAAHHISWCTSGTTYELGPPEVAISNDVFRREYLGRWTRAI